MNGWLIAARIVYFTALLSLFGNVVFDLAVARSPWRRHVAICAVLSLVAMTAWLAIEAALMSDEPLTWETLGIVLGETRFGALFLWRAALLIVVLASAAWRARIARLGAGIAGGAVLVLTAAAGHGGADDVPLHLAADSVHLLAAGAWLGGLIPFTAAMRQPGAGVVAHRFSTLGIACVGLILLTGGTNAWFLVGNVRNLVATDYGRVLLIKIVLFLVLLVIAAVNRLSLDALTSMGSAPVFARLRRNAMIETTLGLAIVVIVAWLGAMAPGDLGPAMSQ